MDGLGEEEQLSEETESFFDEIEESFPFAEKEEGAFYFEAEYNKFSPEKQKVVKARQLIEDLKKLEQAKKPFDHKKLPQNL